MLEKRLLRMVTVNIMHFFLREVEAIDAVFISRRLKEAYCAKGKCICVL